MSFVALLKFLALCIIPYSASSFPDKYTATSECQAQKYKMSEMKHIPFSFDSAIFCRYQDLRVLEDMKYLYLALTTPHTGRSICEIQVKKLDFDKGNITMRISDTDLEGNCVQRETDDIIKVIKDQRTRHFSTLEIRRRTGSKYFMKTNTRLVFTEHMKCLLFITQFHPIPEVYCELFVTSKDARMHTTPCHSIYRMYCGYGRPTRDSYPQPLNSSSDYEFQLEASKIRLLIERRSALKENTIFMNEHQMVTETLYHNPEANLYASTEKTNGRLCGIQTWKILPDFAELEVQVMHKGKKYAVPIKSYYSSDPYAISPTRLNLVDQNGNPDHARRTRRVLVTNYKNCYVLKTVDEGSRVKHNHFCELFVKNNTGAYTGLDECWFVFLAYCGYPAAVYKNKEDCYKP